MNYLEMAKRALSAHEQGTQAGHDKYDQNDISVDSVPISGESGYEPLESVFKGRAIELWSDALGERFWLVADEDDAFRLGEPRGAIYTASEARRIVQIADPSVVAEVHLWKRTFNATVREFESETGQPRRRTEPLSERIPD